MIRLLSIIGILIFPVFSFYSHAQSRYWVGGSGDWSDVSNWSLTSGGVGGASIPTASDDVIFDANSFNNSGNILFGSGDFYCKNLDFSLIDEEINVNSSSTTLTDLHISGNFVGSPLLDASQTFNWDMFFEGPGSITLDPNGTDLPFIVIENELIDLDLLDSLDAVKLSIKKGSFTSNGNYMDLFLSVVIDNHTSVSGDFSNSYIIADSWSNNLTTNSLLFTNSVIRTASFGTGRDANYAKVILDQSLGFGSISGDLLNTTGDIDQLLILAGDYSVSRPFVISDSLIINAGASLSLGFETKITINNVFHQNAGCEFTEIKGTSDSSPRILEVVNTVNLEKVIFKNIIKQGSGSIIANNSLDIGNVTGISFTAPNLEDVYWIGGSGNFDDISHFSSSSGGIADISCLPGPFTNVIFDSNSGLTNASTISIPHGDYDVHDFSFVGNANGATLLLEGANQSTEVNVNIYGDIVLPQDIVIDYVFPQYNQWTLSGIEDHILDTKGHDLSKIFSVSESHIQLQSDLLASDDIDFFVGDFTSNGYDITTDYFDVGGECNGSNCIFKTYDLDGSLISCRIFDSESNFDSLSISGKYKIIAHDVLLGGANVDSVCLVDNEASFGEPGINLFGGSVYHLTIDTDNYVEIIRGGSIESDILVKNANEIQFRPIGIVSTLTLNGNFTNEQAINCNELFPLTKSEATDYFIATNNDSLVLNNVLIQDLKTSGTALYRAKNSRVVLTESFWDITVPSSLNYYWIGGSGLWNDSNNWSFSSGGTAVTAGCLPSLVDNVIFDGNSFTGNDQVVTINEESTVYCNTFLWNSNNFSGLTLAFPAIQSLKSKLVVGKDFVLDPSMIVDGGQYSEIEFIANDMELDSYNRTLPDVIIAYTESVVNLLSDFNCNDLILGIGTLNTNNFDISCRSIDAISNSSSNFYLNLGSSTVNADVTIDLFTGVQNQVVYDADEAILITKDINLPDGDIFQLQLNNVISSDGPQRTHTIDRLILEGAEIELGSLTSTTGIITVNELIFDSPTAHLRLQDPDGLIITESVVCHQAGAKMSAKFLSQADLYLQGNLCVEGPLAFQDINVIDGVLFSPDGIDDGGNSNVDFTDYPDQGKLYWIGGTGTWDDAINWSFSSGACSAGTGAISTYDTLIFDNNSFSIGNNEIFFPANRTAKTMLFRNDNVEAVLNLPFRLRPERVYVDGGKLKFTDLSAAQNRAVQVLEEVHVINNGELHIDSTTLHVARRPNTLLTSALKVDATSSLNADFSVLLISGHGTSVNLPTVDFELDSNISSTNSILKTFEPLSGQVQNDMSFNLNGSIWDKIEFSNVLGGNQSYEFLSNASAKLIRIDYGTVKIPLDVQLEFID